jgi:hypothetical protein
MSIEVGKVKDAAQRLLYKGEITQEEFDSLEKEAGAGTVLGSIGAGLLGAAVASKPVANLGAAAFKAVLPSGLAQIAFPRTTGIIEMLGKAAIPTAVGLGLAAAGAKGYDYLKQKIEVSRTQNQVLSDPMFADKDQDQVKNYFDVVKDFAPTAASNPLVASALVNKMMNFGGVDHKLVQDLRNIEDTKKEYLADQFTSEAIKSLMKSVVVGSGDV